MEYIKDSLYNTKLPVLKIDEAKLYNEYPQIGAGSEGSVHKYNDDIAFKTFVFTPEKAKLLRKFEKIEALGKLHDVSACFPIGLVGYEDEKKEGYYCELVKSKSEFKIDDFDELIYLKETKKVLEYIVKASEAIKRFHKKGLILGDIKGDNIMIDCDDNIKFVDTDNWKYNEFDFDLEPGRTKWLSGLYDKDFSLQDSDKFVFARLCMQSFLFGTIIMLNDRYFQYMIDYLNVSKETKEALRCIFSDSINKPYIGDVIKDIDSDEEIISREHILSLNRVF